MDPQEASADELAAAYDQRWELETSFREIETYLRVGKGIRSKTPELVQQEIWGLFVTHYAIRAFMSEAADTVEMDPDRLSFTRTLHILRRRITDPAVFSPKARNQRHERDIAETIERLNKRRPRTYHRVSKKGNRHNFPTKKPEHHQQRYDPRTILLDRRLPA